MSQLEQLDQTKYPPSLKDLDEKITIFNIYSSTKRGIGIKDYLYATLANAIKEEDEDIVKFIIEETKIDAFFKRNEQLLNIIDLSLNNIHPKITPLILKKVNIDGLSLAIILNKHNSIDVLKLFVKKTKDDHLVREVALSKDYLDNASDFELQLNKKSRMYDSIWNFIYFLHLKSASNYSKRAVDYLDTQFDDILNLSLYNQGLLSFIKTCPIKDNEWHKSILSKVHIEVWRRMFSHSLSDSANLVDFTNDNILFLNSLIEENPSIKKLWNEYNKKLKNNHQDWKKWWDKYLPTNMSVEQTPFYKIVANLVYEENYSRGVFVNINSKNTCGQSHLDNLIEGGEENYNTKLRDSLCLDKNAYIRYIFPTLSKNTDIQKMIDKDTKKVFNLGKVPAYTPPSFMHLLIQTSPPAILGLIKTKQGREQIEECLKDKYVRSIFLTNVNIKVLAKVIRSIPKLKEFKDELGNNLAHMYIRASGESTKTAIMTLYKINKDWFNEGDSNGRYIIDLIRKNKMDKKLISDIEKILLQDNLLSDDNINKKIKSKVRSIPRKI